MRQKIWRKRKKANKRKWTKSKGDAIKRFSLLSHYLPEFVFLSVGVYRILSLFLTLILPLLQPTIFLSYNVFFLFFFHLPQRFDGFFVDRSSTKIIRNLWNYCIFFFFLAVVPNRHIRFFPIHLCVCVFVSLEEFLCVGLTFQVESWRALPLIMFRLA